MDYKELLKKYILHVCECEGTDFISDKYKGMTGGSSYEISSEEWGELSKIADSLFEENS